MPDACDNCGAPVTRSVDGRLLECTYCGPDAGTALDPTTLAAALRGGTDSLEESLHHLAEKLAATLPDHTQVEFSGGFFSSKKVKLVEVTLEVHVYRMKRDGKQIITERVKIVRGVALSTKQLGFDEWVKELSHDMAKVARATAASRAALSRFVRGA